MDETTALVSGLVALLPSHISSALLAAFSGAVTFSTLVMRFWPEPPATSGCYRLWRVLHILATLNLPKRSS